MTDAFLPGDVPPRGGQHAGLVGGFAGGPPTGRAFAQLVLGPVLGLTPDMRLDDLPGDLVPEGTGEGLQLRELGITGQTVGIDLASDLPSHLPQPGSKLIPNGVGILTHLRSPH